MRSHIVVAALCGACVLSARAQTTVETHEVNGFEVRLVDVKAGNQFGVVFNVPFGGADDPPALFGRAHFFEHMYLRGSRRFPGRTAVDDVMKKLGFVYNASTGLDRTLFFAHGLDAHGLAAMDVLLAGLEHPELDAAAFADEKATVTEEVVGSAPNQPGDAARELPFLLLTESDHPARGRHFGDARKLGAMTPAHHRALHDEIYHAGNVRLAVVGNLSGGAVDRAALLSKLAEILPKRPARAAFRPAPAPPVFARDGVIDVVVPNDRSGQLWIPLRPGAELADVRAAMSVFSNQTRGGVTDVGRRELGWFTSLGIYLQRVGYDTFAVVSFDLTTRGYAHRRDVANWLRACLARAGEREYSADLVREMKRRATISYDRLSRSVPSLVQNYGRWLGAPGFEALVDLDFDAQLAHFDPASIRRGMSGLDLGRRMAAFTGEDATGANAHDDFANVDYGVSPWTVSAAPPPVVDPASVRVTPVEVPVATTDGSTDATDVDESRGPSRVVRVVRPHWRDRAVSLRLDFGDLSRSARVSLAAWIHGAHEEIAAEAEQLAADGINVGLDRHSTAIDFDALGDAGREVAAIEWLIERLGRYQPDAAAIERYRDAATLAIKSGEDAFAGLIASAVAGELTSTSGVDVLSLLPEIERLDPETVARETRRTFESAHKTLVIAGVTKGGEIARLLAAARRFSPTDLPAPALPVIRWPVEVTHDEGWTSSAKSGVGLARVFATAGRGEPRTVAALDVITSAMHEKIFPLARPYGYVQSVSHRASSPDNHFVYLVGQAGDPAQAPLIERVWDDELARWARAEPSDAEISAARDGIVSKLSKDDATSSAAVARVFSSLSSTGDPFDRDARRIRVASLGPWEVRAVAMAQLGAGRPSLTVRKGLGPAISCEDLLAGREGTRARLNRMSASAGPSADAMETSNPN